VRLMPRTRGGALLRFAFAGVIVIAFTAAATAVAGLLQFKQFVQDIAINPPIQHAQVTIANPGDPQTLLLIGSDHRAGTPWNSSNTDTMMLVRIDPNSSTINVLSIPRDLKVEIPQGGAIGTGKLNSAYSIGGPGLLVRILRQQVFPGLQINHIIDVNFGGFEALVNAIGCVYTDVDHRYYNNTAVSDYSSIDIMPGYQKLCGADALAFVRFRHTDTDIVRNARQQDFLRWAKDQFSTGELVNERDKLLKIFGQHTQTDANLHTVDGLINLFDVVAFSAGHTVKQIPFPAILLPCVPDPHAQTPCYVTANPGDEEAAFRAFMRPTTASAAAKAPGAGAPAHGARPGGGAAADVTGDLSDGKAQAAALAPIPMRVLVPRVIAAGSRYCAGSIGNCPAEIATTRTYPRGYIIRDQAGNPHVAYRLTLVINPVLGQYYGVQGTTWLNPPILNHPTQTRTVGGKQLLLFIGGGKINLVAFRTPSAVYWVSNTLTNDLSNQQMIAIAASLTPA
jgi:LCP family protein required for cell wall assembly